MKKVTLLQLVFMCFLICVPLFEIDPPIGGTKPPPSGGGPTIVYPGNPLNPGNPH